MARTEHLFVAPYYPPLAGTMARWQGELSCRWGIGEVFVSTTAETARVTAGGVAPERVFRQRFAPEAAGNALNRLRWLRWLAARSHRIALVHASGIRPAGWLAAWGRRPRPPYVVYVTGSELVRERSALARGRRPRGLASVLRGASGIVADSSWTAVLVQDLLSDLVPEPHPPLSAVELAADPAFFRPDRDGARIRARFALGNSPVLLTVGGLRSYKGHDTVMRALALLRSDYSDLRYLIVGSGPEKPKLLALAAQLGVDRQVVFAGQLTDDELADAYAAATLFVMVPRLEATGVQGFGLAFAEAGASGLAVVAGDSGGIRSIVRHRETGLLVDPDRELALATAIAELLGNATLRRRMGEEGRRLVQRYYNWDRVTAQTRDFVEMVCKNDGAAERQRV
jgi:phosphatidylinositol alpha-1,6-mannosyltransferase